MLVCMGVEQSSRVMAHLSNEEMHVVVQEIITLGPISRESRRECVTELNVRYSTDEVESAVGDLSFVERVLGQVLGPDRAALIMEEITRENKQPFGALRNEEPHVLLDILSGEHASVIALVIYYLPQEAAAQVLSGLSDALRNDVVMRLVSLQSPMPQMVARLEQLLAQKLQDSRTPDDGASRDLGAIAGSRALIEIMGHVDPKVERRIYEFLQLRAPALAEEVRNSMFIFEDILRLEQRVVQLVLRELTPQDLAVALKGMGDEYRTLVYGNVSENMSKLVREEAELMGPVRVSQVEQAQQKVIAIIRRMSDEGVIDLRPGEEEEMIA
jgi:flagellar motor switch protein FliG